jgi:hypothetical protein
LMDPTKSMRNSIFPNLVRCIKGLEFDITILHYMICAYIKLIIYEIRL